MLAREYDDAHGGQARAREAAAAVDALLDEHLPATRRVLDLAAGPASVAVALTGVVVTLDVAFTAEAAHRLPGRVLRADAREALPLRSASLDAVVTLWWLHMARDPAAVVAEVARVVRPGGLFLTTADKLAVDEHARGARSERPWRGDATAALVGFAQSHGLDLVGARAFAGHGHPGPGTAAVYPVLGFRRRP